MEFIAKAICALLIVYSATRIGLTIAANYRERPRQLRMLQFALQIMETEINYSSTPLPDLWVKLAKRIDPPIGTIFTKASALLADSANTTAEALSQALQESLSDTALFSSDIEILLTLASSLGRSNREEQIKCIRLVMAELAVEEQKAEMDRQQNERLWRYLGFLTGISLVIVLL